MDPLSAVSLAGNILQFLDFSIKLVSKANEIYHSSEGLESQNLDLELTTQNLIASTKGLKPQGKSDVPKTGAASFAESDDDKNTQALQMLIEQCDTVAQQLLESLQKARIDGKHKRWKSARQALKSVLGKSQVQSIFKRLQLYREQVVVQLLAQVNSKQDGLHYSVEHMKARLVESESRIINDALQTRTQVLDAIVASRDLSDSPQEFAVISELLGKTNMEESDFKAQKTILNSLYFPRMKERQEWISHAHAKTFNWALESNRPAQETPWSDLAEWLKTGYGMYWISGKPGSGKSTLMKYISQDKRTENYLQAWASPKPLVMASFYFWNPGSSMQKSQQGLFQSLLFEVLSQKPSLVSKVFSSTWTTIIANTESGFSWPLSQLIASAKMLADTEFDTQFFFIIDGLDEFDGDHELLLESLLEMTKGSKIKILASSRPWLVFKDTFNDSPNMNLQDLTYEDIKIFAHDSLYNHPRFKKLLASEPRGAPRLVSDIVHKASGVFLWVYLVVRSLMQGLKNGDRLTDLQRRLEQLPTDLEQYFLHILTTVDEFYLQQAAQLFRLALESTHPLSVLTYSFLDEEDHDFALKLKIGPINAKEQEDRCLNIERRLNSRCKGLLEIRKRRVWDSYSNAAGHVPAKISDEVDFLHRTVRDFLNNSTVRVRLVAADTQEFNANMMLTRAFVAQIKGLHATSHAESNYQTLWNLVFSALEHVARVGDEVSIKVQSDLLNELDRAAMLYRKVAISKQRVEASSHWVNTGYRFGLDPRWNNNFQTLCILYGVLAYARQNVTQGCDRGRQGKPLLAFAMTRLKPELRKKRYMCPEYFVFNVDMIRLLLSRGADPNDVDGDGTVWEKFLLSMHQTSSSSEFQSRSRDWFEASKLMIQHGAQCQTKVRVTGTSERPERRLRASLSNTKTAEAINVYLAADILRIAFDGNPICSFLELEELMNATQRNAGLSQPSPPPYSPPLLEIPDFGQRLSTDSEESLKL